MGASPVRLGNRTDDRQTQAGAGAVARLVGTGEALEGSLQELGWKPFALIYDMKLHGAPDFLPRQANLARAVAQGVVDEIAERLLEA